MEEEHQALLEHLGNGGTLNPSSAEETLANTARAVGMLNAFKRILQIDFFEEEEEGEGEE